MNKKLASFFLSYGMKIDKNRAYGLVNGFETNAIVRTLDNVAPLTFHLSFYATDAQKHDIEGALRSEGIKFFVFQFSPYGITLGFNDLTIGKLLKRLPLLLERICELIRRSGALGAGYCPVCGKQFTQGEAGNYLLDGFTLTMDRECAEKINAVIRSENNDFENAPNNYLRGFLGALIGGLVGAALAFVLYMAGFFSSVSAIVAVVLGSFLYRKFQGKQDKMMIVIIVVTTLVCMVLSVLGVYLYAAHEAAVEAGLEMSVFEAFRICMDDAEFSRYFYGDLALILVFSVIGLVYQIVYLARQIKRKEELK